MKSNLHMLPAILALLLCSAQAGAVTSSYEPERLVAGKTPTARVLVRGLPGKGAIEVLVNVGQVSGISMEGNNVRFKYTLPSGPMPRMACVLLWRKGGEGAAAIRMPIFGEALVPIETAPRARVRVRVGKKQHGPFKSGRKGKLEVPLMVPPGIAHVDVESTARTGLKTTKSVGIERPAYPQVVLMAREVMGKDGEARVHVLAAMAEQGRGKLLLEAGSPGSKPRRVALRPLRTGALRAVLGPVPFGGPRRMVVRVWTDGAPDSGRVKELDVTPGPDYAGMARVALAQRNARIILWSGVGLTAGLMVAGVVTGQLASDRSGEYRDLDTPLDRRVALNDQASSLSSASIGLFAAGGAVAVGTALYYWFGYRGAMELRAGAAPIDGGVAASVGGRF